MKRKLIAIASAVALSASAAGAALADITVAGWDFSQYAGDGVLGGLKTLPANYSNFDVTHNAGAESALFGTAHFDGLFSSSNTVTDFLPTAGTMNCERLPSPPEGCATPNVNGPVRSNRTEPWSGVGETAFDSLVTQSAEGAANANLLGMTAINPVSVVFEADIPGSDVGGPYVLSFGGKTFTGGGTDGGQQSCGGVCRSTVGIDFSPDGTTYASAGTAFLTPADTRFVVTVPNNIPGGGGSPKGYFRLNLDPTDGQPIIDNVAVDVKVIPEPGAVAQICAGVVGVGLLARRRFRS